MRDIMKLLQQAQEMQGKMAKLQEELQAMTLTGTAGGGMVTVDVNGQGLVKRVKIDPSVVNPTDTEMLEDLIAVAAADAQRKAQERQQEQMGALTGGMNLPFKLPFGG
jgi:nucleoid-associated protein EbfC